MLAMPSAPPGNVSQSGDASGAGDAPLPVRLRRRTVIDAGRKMRAVNFGELWNVRELLLMLTWREMKVRYKQTIFGVAWALIQPLCTVFVFTLLFGGLLGVESRIPGVPYALFVVSGLLPWTLFSGVFTKASSSVLDNQRLVTKVYFPRLALPLAAVGVNLVDFFIAFGMLGIMMLSFGVTPPPAFVLLPFVILTIVLAGLGISTGLAALLVFYRDVRFVTPFLLQLWFYLTPVIYPISVIPQRYRWALGLNPMAGPLMAFRGCLFGFDETWNLGIFLLSLTTSLIVLACSMLYFQSRERRFADCI